MNKTDTSIPVLKLRDRRPEAMDEPSEAMTMFRIWTLLTNGAATRDLTVADRKIV